MPSSGVHTALGELDVTWCGGALYLEHGGVGLLLDAPPGVVEGLGDRLARLQAIVLTSGRIRSVGGLLPLLVALEPHRVQDVPFSVVFPLGEERGAMLAESWVRGWPDRFPLTLDAQAPGSTFDAGQLTLRTMAVRTGEPHWRRHAVRSTVGVAVQVHAAEAMVAWVPGAAPTPAVGHVCRGADLAVVEVGVVPWPRTSERWRMNVSEAMRYAPEAGALWVVGDDGQFATGEAH